MLKKQNIHLKIGDSSEELSKFDNNYFDWVYIDANHLYEHVIKDLNIANQKIKKNGLIVCNDYIYSSHVQNNKKYAK